MKTIHSLKAQTERFSRVYLVLVLVTALLGAAAFLLWQEASSESLRVNAMVQAVETMRGQLYRQMKELFDATFLDDTNAEAQYKDYGDHIEEELKRLSELARGDDEINTVKALKRTYRAIHARTDAIISGPIPPEGRVLQRIFDTDIETGGLEAYEAAFREVDQVFTLEQARLGEKLLWIRYLSPVFFGLPVVFAIFLLWVTRRFIREAVILPFQNLQAGTRVIASGQLSHRLPVEGAEEVRVVSSAINQMAKELADSRAALIKAERQATLGALIPVVAHNIRNPLASIRATAQVMSDESTSPELREGLQGIMLSTDRLERWTASLLSYLHPLETHTTRVAVSTVLEALVGLVAPAFKHRGVSLVTALPDYSIEAEIDVDLIEQAIYGILMNALEASPAHGTVILELVRREQRVEISVYDEGPGLSFSAGKSAEARQPITPGRTTKRTGTGLGIPFALKVSEVHDGGLRYLSRSPKGTQALFWFPA